MSKATADDGDGGAEVASVADTPGGVEVVPVASGSGGAEIASVARASVRGDAALGMLQRVLLTTDATVVRLLEGCFGESICTEGLGQACRQASPEDAELEPAGHETILCRETLLQGSDTGRNYLYAEACVVLDRLESSLREGLLTTSEPIGRLLAANRTETFRETLRLGRKPAGPLGLQFDLEGSDELLFRTYRVIAEGKPIMLITEYFPASPFSASGVGRGGEVLDPDADSSAAARS